MAEAYRRGREFLAGDAARVWPPAQALGANSAVQDAHNCLKVTLFGGGLGPFRRAAGTLQRQNHWYRAATD